MLAAAVSAPRAVWAQKPDDSTHSVRWAVERLHIGFCLHFLVDSATAERLLDDAWRPVRADQVASLHPVLKQAVDGDSRFAAWTPGQLCLYTADAVALEGKRDAYKTAGRPETVGVLGLAARPDVGPSPTDGMALKILADDWRLAQATETELIDIQSIETSRARPDEGATDERLVVRLDKSRFIFDGHAAGDSSAAPRAIGAQWAAKGLRNTAWTAAYAFQPTTVRSYAGAVRVEGKDRLSKALQASPVRFVGPVYEGGNGEIVFTRR